MANALMIFDSAPQLPADVAAFLDESANIVPKETVPSLSYEGKTWTISLNGEKTPLMRRNADGDEEPVAVFRAVVLDYAKRRGRAYYAGAYDPTKASMPSCWSDDGITPSPHVKAKQADACAKCPLSVKGSKITEQGKSVTACGEHRMIVVVPASRLDFEPLRLKLAITSDYDGQSPEQEAQGWFGFRNYTDMLRTKQVQHTCMLVTKMKFDPSVAYPKVMFSADKWLEPAQIASLVPIVKDEKVKKLISGSWTPDGVDGRQVQEVAAEEKPAAPVAEKPAAPKPAATAKPAPARAKPADDDDEGEPQLPASDRSVQHMVEAAGDDEGEPELPAKPPAKAAAPKASPKAAPKASPKAAPVANGASTEDLDQLLADWS